MLGADMTTLVAENQNLVASGLQQVGADLTKMEFFWCTIASSTFDRAILRRSWFQASTVTDTSFRGADLTEADFQASTFERCDFTGARLCNVAARRATFRGCTFTAADLAGIDLQEATFAPGTFDGACLAGARFEVEDRDDPAVAPSIDDVLGPGVVIGDVRLDDEVAGAMANAIYRGSTVVSLPVPVLVTCGPRQRRPRVEVRAELLYKLPGVAAMVAVVEAKTPSQIAHVLVEERPDGVPLAELAPLAPPDVVRVLADIAKTVVAADDFSTTLYGIHPALAYCRRDGDRVTFTGLAPRAMRFLLGMPPARGGLCLDQVYLPMEVWRDPNREAESAADVFALCALGTFLLTGEHPFAGPTFDASIAAVASGRVPAVPGALGHLLLRGLAAQPEARLSAAELGAALAGM